LKRQSKGGEIVIDFDKKRVQKTERKPKGRVLNVPKKTGGNRGKK